jgi:hypothetical protein
LPQAAIDELAPGLGRGKSGVAVENTSKDRGHNEAEKFSTN